MALKKVTYESLRLSRSAKKYIEAGMYLAWVELLGETSVKSLKSKKFIEFQKAFLIGAVVASKLEGDVSVYDFPQSWLDALRRGVEIERTK